MKKTMLNKFMSIALVMILAISGLTLSSCGGDDDDVTTSATPTTVQPVSNYIHIKWADQMPVKDDQMNSTGGSYMGIYTGTSATAPQSYTKYTWVKIKGEDGTAAIATNGKDGIDGQPGKSAYQIALDNGYIGTEEEWLVSLKGKDGSNGNDGIGIDGQNGKSAYEIALQYMTEPLTEEEWIRSLQGKDGVDGADGSGVNAYIESISPSAGMDRYNIKVHVDKAGDSVYMLKVYCNTYATPGTVGIEWVGCSAVNSIQNTNHYYVMSGDPTAANSQVILMIPVAPYYKNYFEANTDFYVRITGITVELAQIETAKY